MPRRKRAEACQQKLTVTVSHSSPRDTSCPRAHDELRSIQAALLNAPTCLLYGTNPDCPIVHLKHVLSKSSLRTTVLGEVYLLRIKEDSSCSAGPGRWARMAVHRHDRYAACTMQRMGIPYDFRGLCKEKPRKRDLYTHMKYGILCI